MKALIIIIGILLLLLIIIFSIAIQFFRALRNTNQKLNDANIEIAALKDRIKMEKTKQEIINDEQKKADKDKEDLHTGTNADKFNAANDILRKRQN